jgi:hypothetical protein
MCVTNLLSSLTCTTKLILLKYDIFQAFN